MIRVAIETATRVGSVAVGREDGVLAAVTLGVQTRHAASALPALDAALRMAGVERSGVEAVVVGAGPGSFTGVRVAGATAKGLATSLGVPLLAYSSLLALAVDGAAGARAGAAICGLFDARRGEAYGGCWRVGRAASGGARASGGPQLPGASRTPGLQEVLAPMVGPVEGIVEGVADALAGGAVSGGAAAGGRAVVFVGEGVERYRAELVGACEAAGLEAELAGLSARPRAEGLLWLAHHHPDAGRVADAGAWEPSYVRGSSAERGIPG